MPKPLQLYTCLVALLFCLPNQAKGEAVEFSFPAPFQQLYAPVNRLYSTFAHNQYLFSSAYIGNVNTVTSGKTILNTSINPQNNNDFTQLIEPGAWVENSSMGAGNWLFMPGSGLKGHNIAGILHNDEVICSCNTPEHDLKMILPQGVKAEGEITLNYAQQHIFGDYYANTALNNGAYQVIFPSARVFGNTNIYDAAETNLRGKIMPDAKLNLHSGGVFRISDQARLEGTLNVLGGLAFAYDNAFVNKVDVSQDGSIMLVNNNNYNNVSVGDVALLNGRVEANGGKFKSIIAQKGLVKFSEPGVLDKTTGPGVSGCLQIGPEATLVLEGNTTPLALDSKTSTLELKNGDIKLEAAWWQTTSTIRELSGKGKITFAYTLNPSFLMDYYPQTPLPISQLKILNGHGDFEIEIFAYPKQENLAQKNLEAKTSSTPRPIPNEFVLIEDYSNALKFKLAKNVKNINRVNIEGRYYTLEASGQNPTVWTLKTTQLMPAASCPLKTTPSKTKQTPETTTPKTD